MLKHLNQMIGLGTYELLGAACSRIVEEALEIGYRHIDTAHVYGNHHAIGKGIKSFPREKLFITSKIALDQIDDQDVEGSIGKACDLALSELDTPYLDLYLIHWPDRKRPLEQMLEAMNGLISKGKIRHAGVSNYTIHHLQDGLKMGLKIEANQVEFHPYLYQKELLKFCNQNQIRLIAYRPFGKGKLLQENPLFNEIGKKYRKSGAQVILRWLVQKDVPVIPKASSKKHMAENFAIFDFALTEKEMQSIDELNKNHRYCDPDWEEFNY